MADNQVQYAEQHERKGQEAAAAAEEVRRLLANASVSAVRHELQGLAGMFRRRAARHFQFAEQARAQRNRRDRRRRTRNNGDPK